VFGTQVIANPIRLVAGSLPVRVDSILFGRDHCGWLTGVSGFAQFRMEKWPGF
jgi:hypothetical protein